MAAWAASKTGVAMVSDPCGHGQVGWVVVQDRPELPQEVREMARQGAMPPPPGEPLERLVQGHVRQLTPEFVRVEALAGRGLVLLDVGGAHGLPLRRGPLALGEAHQVERSWPAR